MKRIDWYILRELAGPFFFGVAAFTSIMVGSSLLFRIASYIIELDMPIELASKLFLLELPGIIVLTFPMSTLLATLLAFGRLSGNSEIIAFKAGGISFARLVAPVILVGILASFLTIYVNERIVPVTTYESRRLVWEFTHQSEMPVTQRYLSFTPIDYKTQMPEYILYAEQFDGEKKTLQGVYFQDFEGRKLTAIIQAKEAKWLDNQWIFFQGKTYYFPSDDGPVVIGNFSEYEMKALNRTPAQISLAAKKPEEMSATELKEIIKLYKKEGRNVNKLAVTYHQRFAIPLSCLIFALIGAPLGLQPNRSGSSIGLGLSILVIFVYYIVLTVSGAISQAGVVSPLLGGWLPNLIFGTVGIGLIIKASY